MDAPAQGPQIPMSLKELRQARARRLAVRFGMFVGLPTLLAALYFGFVASDQFESISPFTVQSAEGHASFGLESLVGVVPGAGNSRDALSVREYILSRDVLLRLDREHGLLTHFKDPNVDFWARLPEDATIEEAFEYYLDMVEVHYDTMSSVLTLRVKAFSADKAQEFAQAILAYSEEMVNDLAERARIDSVAFAERQVMKAEQRLTKAREALLELQGEGAELNPEQSATATLTIRSELQGELAKARTELSQARAFMRGDAPKVIALTQKVNSLVRQIDRQNKSLLEPKDGESMPATLAKFEKTMLEKEFAQATYATALGALEVAHAEAGRQHRYLATIAQPSLPDESTYPRRIYGTVTVFAIALALFAMLSLLIAAVREHARL